MLYNILTFVKESLTLKCRLKG